MNDPSELSYWQARAAVRDGISDADKVIERYHTAALTERGAEVPPMDASPEDLAVTPTAEITVSAKWLAWMFTYLDDEAQR